MSNLDNANSASQDLIDSSEWLLEELKPVLGEDHPLLSLASHVVAETYRVAVLCALAKSDG